MYLLTWNEDAKRVEATFGGRLADEEVTRAEKEFRALLRTRKDEPFSVCVDFATVSTASEGAVAAIMELRNESVLCGAQSIVLVARTEPEAQALAAERVAQVTAGKEEYLAFGLPA